MVVDIFCVCILHLIIGMMFINYLIRNYFAQILCSDLLFTLSGYFSQLSLVSAVIYSA